MQTLAWTFPTIMLASVVIGWGAELASIHISAGLALAILALLQTLPEFGVEAYIAWSGNTSLMLANLTGSLRLFVGFGWPIVFFIHAFSLRFGRAKRWPRAIVLPPSFAVEATFLLLPIVFFLYVGLKNHLSAYDGICLCLMYLAYLGLLNAERKWHRNQPSSGNDTPEDHDLDYVPAKLATLSRSAQITSFLMMFVLGGILLYIAVHPFVEGLKHAAVALGMTEFVFIQWVAPFASEFPEKVTAFGWARKASKVPMAIFNMVSSSVNQWTLLAGFVPLIYSLSLKRMAAIEFDAFQHSELMLTVAQSALGALFLADLKFHALEACGLFLLWGIQFLLPHSRELITYVYVVWVAAELAKYLLRWRLPRAWQEFGRLIAHLCKGSH